MPEDDDLNYPLLDLLLLQRHGHGFTTADVARLWLDELPAGRAFTAERVAYRNLLDGCRAPAHRAPPQPVPGVDRRPDPSRRPRLDPPRRPGSRSRAGVPRRGPRPTRPTASTARCSSRRPLAEAAGGAHGRARLSGAGPARRAAALPATRARSTSASTALAEPPDHGASTPSSTGSTRRTADHHWVHVLPNAALLAAALTHADGDFTRSICCAVVRRLGHRLQRCDGGLARGPARRATRRAARPVDRPAQEPPRHDPWPASTASASTPSRN